MTTTRFLNGVNTEADNSIFKDLPIPSPSKCHCYFNDFDTYVSSGWTVTEGNAGATEATSSADGGVITLTTTTATTDKVYMQLGEANTVNTFLMEAGKKAWFEVRLKTSEVTTNGILAGLHVSNSTDYAPTDGIYFYKAASAATVAIVCRKNTTSGSTSATATTLVADTWVRLGWYYDGVDKLYYAVDGVIKGSLDASSTYLPDGAIGVNFAITSAAAANTLSVDYILAAKER